MNSHPTFAGVEDLDDVTIDLDLDGVTSGSGMLAAMLAERGLLPAGIHLAGVASRAHGSFATQDFLSSLAQYEAEHRSSLFGQGLLLETGHSSPPFALPGVMSYGGEKTTLLDQEPSESGPVAFEQTEQAAWLINATLVRASLTMAGFALGRPTIELNELESPHRFLFQQDARAEAVLIDKSTSPLSLHREVRIAIQRTWRNRIAASAGQVATEYERALVSNGLSAESAIGAKDAALRAITSSDTFAKMKRSSALFIDINQVAKVCIDFVESLDRVAIRNALRHGASGLSWTAYAIHSAPAIQGEIGRFEDRGSLAYADYSPGLLELIAVGASRSVGFGFGLTPVEGAAGRETAEFTSKFMRALDAESSGTVKAALQRVSPRYLSVLALGQADQESFAEACTVNQTTAPGPRSPELLGKRLARALNEVGLASKSKDFLPWMRVLSSRTAYELLQHESPDVDVIRGLKGLILFANGKRAKGARIGDVAYTLPTVDELLAAPDGQELRSLAGMYEGGTSKMQSQARKTALAVLKDFVADMRTQTTAAGWQIDMAGLRPNREIKISVRHPGTRPKLWTLLTIIGRTSPAFSANRFERIDESSYHFAWTSAKTPQHVAPLVFSVGASPTMRFKPLVTTSTKGAAALELGLHALEGDLPGNPKMRDGPSSASADVVTRLLGELPEQLKDLAGQLRKTVTRRPLQAACLFPALATYMLAGGQCGERRAGHAPGANLTLRYARACVGAENAPGLELLCASSSNPNARSSAGLSVLDIALDAGAPEFAGAVLNGLRANGRLAKEELASLVQASAGKLVERQPSLLPQAVELGLAADATLLQAWSALHPHRKSPELEAQIADMQMNCLIDQRLKPLVANAPSMAFVQPPESSARRRARVI